VLRESDAGFLTAKDARSAMIKTTIHFLGSAFAVVAFFAVIILNIAAISAFADTSP
jgi:hypothetical protein